MIASQVMLPGPNNTEIEVRLESGEKVFADIWLTTRNPHQAVSMRLSRGTAVALANILSGWASELSVWPGEGLVGPKL